MRHILLFALCVAVIAMTAGPIDAATGNQITIAVVRDGPATEEDIVPLIEEELQKILERGTEVRFKSVPGFNAQWDPDRMIQVIMNALNDPEVDILLAPGALITDEASKEDVHLTKPLVSSFVQRTDLFKMPYSEDGHSLKENFSFIFIPQGAERDIKAFQSMLPIQILHIALGQDELQQLAFLRSRMEAYGETLAVKIKLLPVYENLDRTLAGLGADTEAVLIARTPRLSRAQRKAFIDALTAKKIPSFSLTGHSDVELGAMAALTPDLTQQVVRRVGLNLNQHIRGVPARELPVLLSVSSKLLVNGRTARAVGYIPNFETLIFASFLHEEALESDAKPLNFKETLVMAEKNNVTLSIRDYEVETSGYDVKRARSPLLPQAVAGAEYQNLNQRRADPIFPDDVGSAGIALSQMIYDDRAVSDYRSSSRLFESTEQMREVERLNVLAAAGEAFLRLALARVLYRIEADNVALTEDNLELSRLRYDVGYSGRDEIYRWEAELANTRSALLDRKTGIEVESILLNQILGIEQSLRWLPEKIAVEEYRLYFLDGELDPIFRNAADLETFLEAMVAFAFENAPEIKSLDKTIESQEIQLGQRKRTFILPAFNANFFYDYDFYQSPDFPEYDKNNYGFTLMASYPIFNGMDRYYDAKRTESVLQGLEREVVLAREIVEKRTRDAVRRMENSFPVIKLRIIAAENARKNLELVQEKYAQGLVNITDLLEAQNQNFTAEQNAAAAETAFLIDLVAFQRAASWFEFEKSAEEREALIQKIKGIVYAE